MGGAHSQRILVCGLCPLPFENTSRNYGPGIRTWQLAKGLAGDGHSVRVVAMVIPGVYEEGELAAAETVDGISIRRLDGAAFLDPAVIRREIRQLRPGALVGATIYGSLALAQCGPAQPLWADQFGHVMAEAQAKAALEGENWPVPRWWRMVLPVASRADRISVVSERQRYAAIGELGAIGRLTGETCGYEFTSVIPCGLVEEPPFASGSAAVVRGRAVPADAFIVLWSGGYNVWSDVETLFAGLDAAMEAEESVVFVSTGGAIDGHDDSTYARFRELVAASAHRSRYHLAGWVKREAVPAYVAEADLGVLTDRPMYEGTLGSKNRVVQWLATGLPAVYNRVGDIGDYLARGRFGLTFPVGDAAALGERILWAARNRDELAEMAERARRACRRDFSFTATTVDLRAWAAAPSHAPDFRPAAVRSPFDFEEAPAAPPPPDPAPRPRGWRRRLRAAARALLGR
ncbi:MAG: glycosyltransferase [Acidobacteriota bacterium]|nr:glycosyltransferase [Acidobacteriota bacterium]MDH3522123.1 glycosyltransferase [Acidobacteriota bacterium]